MAFHDVRLSEDIERGATGGPQFSTTVKGLSSGFEKRNINWEDVRGAWDIGYGLMHKDPDITDNNYTAVLNFFYVRQGRAHSFRFKDWSDFEIGDFSDNTSREFIGTGDNLDTIFQIIKRYTSGGINYDRTIAKIVDGTFKLFVNGALQTITADYTIDLLTGIVTFAVAPPAGQLVEVIAEFDVPVRFDVDRFGITLQQVQAGSVPDLPLVEVRGE